MSGLWAIPLSLLAAAGILLFLVAPGASAQAKRGPFCGRNFAHRGLYAADQSQPENSLEAFRAARSAGYGVELDVQLSKDGEVVVFHDDDLLRVCGIDARVDAYTTQELAALSLFGTSERIPLFTEALDVLGSETPVIVELKTGARNDLLCENTLAILRAKPGIYCVESFDPRIVAWFRSHAPEILRGQLVMSPKHYGGSKLTAFVLGNLLFNCIARAQFIAYDTRPQSIPVKLCLLMKPMRVIWTVRPEHDPARRQLENDAVIFEYYKPEPRF